MRYTAAQPTLRVWIDKVAAVCACTEYANLNTV